MFQKSQYVVCGNKGVCSVEDITTLDISGVDKARQYYILKPIYVEGSTVYVPVDTNKEAIREVMGREAADSLIREIAKVPLILVENEKQLEQEYKNCMKENSCENWIRIIKTIYLRKQKRVKAGRKITAVDAKYRKLAEDNLYGELAVSLKMERKSVEAYIEAEMGKESDSVGINF